MTKYPNRLFALAALLLAASCTSTTDKIAESAYNYSFAMANYKVADAMPYCTPETQETTLQFASQMMEKVPEEYIASDTPAEIEIKYIAITSDTTATVVYHKITPIKNFDGTLNMVKRGKAWLAHTPMESKAGTADNQPAVVADTVTLNGKKIQLFHIQKQQPAD